MSRVLQMSWKTVAPRRAVPGMSVLDTSVTELRVNPFDLDLLFHVNNGVYLQMADVARWDFLADLGALNRLRKRRWYPVVAAASVKFKKSLKVNQKVKITSQVLGWDSRIVYMQHIFTVGDQLYATVWIAGRFLQVGGKRISPEEVVDLLSHGDAPESPELPPDVLAWARALDVAERS